MREQIQKYYADKKIFWRIVIVIAFVLVIFFQLNGDKRGMDISFSNKLSFAGEVMPKN